MERRHFLQLAVGFACVLFSTSSFAACTNTIPVSKEMKDSTAVSTWSAEYFTTGSSVPNTSSVWMNRCMPIDPAQLSPSSMICAAVKCSAAMDTPRGTNTQKPAVR